MNIYRASPESIERIERIKHKINYLRKATECTGNIGFIVYSSGTVGIRNKKLGKWTICKFDGNMALYSFCKYCGHTHPCYKEQQINPLVIKYDKEMEYNYCPMCGKRMKED